MKSIFFCFHALLFQYFLNDIFEKIDQSKSKLLIMKTILKFSKLLLFTFLIVIFPVVIVPVLSRHKTSTRASISTEASSLHNARCLAKAEARKELADLFNPWFQNLTLKEISERLDRCGVCWGPYRTFRQMLDEDPRCSTENPMFSEIDQPGVGRRRALAMAKDE